MASVREQIEILENRGVKFSSKKKARNILLNYNYYNVINGYKDIFLDKHSKTEKYKEGTKFEDIFYLYDFDARLKYLFLKYLFIVEENIKTHLSYEFTIMYGEAGYKDIKNFASDEIQWIDAVNLLYEISKVIKRYSKDDRVLYFKENNKDVPFFVLVTLFDLGTTRLFYNCCKDSLKNTVSKKYYNLSSAQFYSCLSIVNMFRNICAHGSRLYCAIIKDQDKKLSDLPIHENMNLKHNIIDGQKIYLKGKNDLFSVVIALRYLLKEDEFKKFYDQLKNEIKVVEKQLGSECANEILDKMSFPKEDKKTNQKSWEEIINISKDKVVKAYF